MEGKIVQFEVLEFHPQSALGYNLWAGEHLNFVPDRHPNAQQGDILIVKADTIRNNIGSWVINYTEVDDAVADSSTIYNTQESDSAQADTPLLQLMLCLTRQQHYISLQASVNPAGMFRYGFLQ